MSQSNQDKAKDRRRLFTWWQIPAYAGVFLIIIRVLQTILRRVCTDVVAFDCPYYWPISIFQVRSVSARDVLVALGVLAVFFAVVFALDRLRYDLRAVAAAAVLLIAGTTFIQGLESGFYAPVAGYAQEDVYIANSKTGQEYYHDALTITDPVDTFRRYNEIQPALHNHAHTHPPGAILTYYFLNRILGDPGLISLFLMILATVPTVWFFYLLAGRGVSEETGRYTAFVLAVLPAVQIYYLSTIDAVVAALLTGTIYFFAFGRGARATVASILLLCLSFLLTFVSLFLLPVLVGFDVLVRRSVRRSALVIGSVVGFFLIVYLVTGYDAWHSFREASHYENPNGFMLFVDPANYFFTRLEDVSELMLFFGPFLLVLFARGMRGYLRWSGLRERPLILLTFLAVGTMLAMFAVGAWRTGETARACVFLYPYLLFPVALYLDARHTTRWERIGMATLVFLQTVGMQLIGDFHW